MFAGVAAGCVALVIIGLVALLSWRELLLRWYLGEVARLDIAEDPGEAIVTYPLA